MVLKWEIQFWKKANCHVLTSGFTVLEGSGSQVFSGEASATGEAGSTASFRLECAQGTELAGCKAISRIFTRLAQTWRPMSLSEQGPQAEVLSYLSADEIRLWSGLSVCADSAPTSVTEALSCPALH